MRNHVALILLAGVTAIPMGSQVDLDARNAQTIEASMESTVFTDDRTLVRQIDGRRVFVGVGPYASKTAVPRIE